MLVDETTPIPDGHSAVYEWVCDHPEFQLYRYIGRSNNPKRRYGEHARRGGEQKYSFIDEAERSGADVCMRMLETVPFEEEIAAERKWIRSRKESGFILLNANEGCGGPSLVTEETRAKMSSSSKAMWRRLKEERRIHEEKLAETLWSLRLQGLTMTQIGERTGLGRNVVWNRLRSYGYDCGRPQDAWIPTAKKLGIDPAQVRQRLKNGWELERALTEPMGQYGSGARKAKANGIAERTYHARIERGWTEEQATTVLPHHDPTTGILWVEVARANGIKTQSYHARVQRGWTQEKAATTPLLRTRKHA